MIATGVRKEGRLAGGAVTPNTYPGSGVFGDGQVSRSRPASGTSTRGLVDKQQQVNPASTIFSHPNDTARNTATLKKVPPKTGFNVIHQLNPLKQNVPQISPNTRGTFFVQNKIVPIVKMQFGTNQSGKQSSTAFHPQTKLAGPQPKVVSGVATEKVTNQDKLKSFHSTGNIWSSANHSFIAGKPNTLSGSIGVGRWNITKVGAV